MRRVLGGERLAYPDNRFFENESERRVGGNPAYIGLPAGRAYRSSFGTDPRNTPKCG